MRQLEKMRIPSKSKKNVPEALRAGAGGVTAGTALPGAALKAIEVG